MPRDQPWAPIYNVADRMNRRYTDTTLRVRPVRRRVIRGWCVVEGLEAAHNWTDVFEPVRRGRMFGRRWTELQAVQQAPAKIGQFIRERPDLF
jgi:hypothetical protein